MPPFIVQTDRATQTPGAYVLRDIIRRNCFVLAAEHNHAVFIDGALWRDHLHEVRVALAHLLHSQVAFREPHRKALDPSESRVGSDELGPAFEAVLVRESDPAVKRGAK